MVDPAMPGAVLLEKVAAALEGGVRVLQIWNNWPLAFTQADKQALMADLVALASGYAVPVLVNEEWQLLKNTALAGVHFDAIPPDFEKIKAELGSAVIYGITCGNNLEVIRWASKHQLDYVSFCAVFPSASAGACKLVRPETIRQARQITAMPFFLSGGITTENLITLKGLDFDGVAVISGILSAPSARDSASAYQQALNKNHI